MSMLHFFRRKLVYPVNGSKFPTTLFLQSFSNSTKDDSSSYTVSYLINSCGFSPEAAVKTAKSISLKPRNQPDSVLNFFKDHGLTKPQITNLIKDRPALLLSNPQRSFYPKIEFLRKGGLSEGVITKIISSGSGFLLASLETRIIPSFNLLKSLLPDNRDVALAITNSCGIEILRKDPEKMVLPKIKILRDRGVPDSNISKLLVRGLGSLAKDNQCFDDMVNYVVEEIGFDPSSKMFAHALAVVARTSRATRERKMDVYRSFGWSEDEIFSAIRKQPTCLGISEKKLKVQLDFFMNKLGWKPSWLVKAPHVLGLSLEKRIIPRLRVLQLLISKGLIENDIYIVYKLYMTDANFNMRFITMYEGECDELIKLKQGLPLEQGVAAGL